MLVSSFPSSVHEYSLIVSGFPAWQTIQESLLFVSPVGMSDEVSFTDVVYVSVKAGIHTVFFSKPGDTLLVVSDWRNATPCLILSRLALYCMVQNKPLPYRLMTLSNTGCNWFAQCRWGIWYVSKVWNGCSHLMKNHMLKIAKDPDKAKRDKARQGKTRRPPTTKVSPGFEKYFMITYRSFFGYRTFWCRCVEANSLDN